MLTPIPMPKAPEAAAAQLSQALAAFDTTFTTSLLWGHSVTPFNNGISAGTIPTQKFPIIFDQDTGQFTTQLQKRVATGGQITVSIEPVL